MRQFINIITEAYKVDRLDEAQDYSAMFNKLLAEHPYDPVRNEVAEAIKMAKRTLKRNDRIVWFLKSYRALAVGNFKEHNDLSVMISNMISYRVHSEEFFNHMLSLPVPNIQNYVFPSDENVDVVTVLERFEEEWQEELNGADEYIPMTKEMGTPFIKFPDGSAWVRIAKPSCDIEGRAMGHCGNKGNPRSTDVILSYRSVVKRGDKNMWKPHLTFIFNTTSGMLGEMKGRANEKPSEKYHNVILELLKSPMIKGIEGGGYAPANNFAITDLSPEKAAYVTKNLPRYATPTMLWNEYGTEGGKVAKAVKQSMFNMSGLEFDEVHDDHLVYASFDVTERQPSMSRNASLLGEFLNDYLPDQSSNATFSTYVLRNGGESTMIAPSLITEAFYKMPDEVREKMVLAINHQFPEAVTDFSETSNEKLHSENILKFLARSGNWEDNIEYLLDIIMHHAESIANEHAHEYLKATIHKKLNKGFKWYNYRFEAKLDGDILTVTLPINEKTAQVTSQYLLKNNRFDYFYDEVCVVGNPMDASDFGIKERIDPKELERRIVDGWPDFMEIRL